jgi:DNA invertase Pin-like site-specific DNA recombinase
MEERQPITIGYARVSSGVQNSESQIYEIQRYAAANGVTVHRYVQETISSTKKLDKRALSKLLQTLQNGDTLIIAEISRIGRSLFEVMALLGRLLERGIQVYAIKQNWWLGNNLISKVQAMGFTLSADLERELISQRTKDGLARAKAEGRLGGRRKGVLSAGKLNGNQDEIVEMLKEGKSMRKIAQHFQVHGNTVMAFIKRYGLDGSEPILQSIKSSSIKVKYEIIKETPIKFIEPALLIKTEISPSKVWAYLRVSTDKQTNENQQIQIQAFAERKGWLVAEWCEETISSRRKLEERAVWDFVNRIEKGEVLIISEISRLGRSQGEVLRIFEMLLSKGVLVYSVRDNYCFSNDAASKTIIGCIAIAVQIERELISQRTTEALKLKVAQGVILGRKGGVACGLSSAYYKFISNKELINKCLEEHIPVYSAAKQIGIEVGVFRRFCKKILGSPYEKLLEQAGFKSQILTKFLKQKDAVYAAALKGLPIKYVKENLVNMSFYSISQCFKEVFGCYYNSLKIKGRESWPEIMNCKKCGNEKPKELFINRVTCNQCNNKRVYNNTYQKLLRDEKWRDPLFLAKELINKTPLQIAEENHTSLRKLLFECRRNNIIIVKKPKEKKIRVESKRLPRSDKRCKSCNIAHNIKELSKDDCLCKKCIVLRYTEEYDAVRKIFEDGGIIQITGRTKSISCNGQYFCKTCKEFKLHENFSSINKSKCKPCAKNYNKSFHTDPTNMRGKKHALEVMEMQAKGLSYEEIKNAFSASFTTFQRVIKYLKASGFQYPIAPSKPKVIKKELKAKVANPWENKEMLQTALMFANATEVGKKWGCSDKTITIWAKKHGIK